jgi:hypothetical protein
MLTQMSVDRDTEDLLEKIKLRWKLFQEMVEVVFFKINCRI